MQLIVFFKREKLSLLLDGEGVSELFIQLYSQVVENEETGAPDIVYFNTHNEKVVFYIDSNGLIEAADFNPIKARKASILMIPDTIEIDYSPSEKFAILRHSNEPKILQKLLKSKFHPLVIRQNEANRFKEKESLYYRVIQFIGNTKGITFDKFCEENKEIIGNPKLEATLYFLTECLDANKISENTENMIKEGLNIECLKDKGFEKLTDIRDCLLEQCHFHN
ncbi:MAG TPA: hypothetical protein VFC67_01730 [Prolixibacteraceae bacterium]|nr:hypothetical protein [Prolixibacteraceae bacterium]